MPSIVYQGKHYQTYGDLPTVGSSAPDIMLVNTDLANVSLSHWSGKRKLLYVFVSIDTEVCARSVAEFAKYAEANDDVVLLMVSYDLPFAHRRFLEAQGLGDSVYGLSAIRHAGFGENYGVLITEGPLAGMFARAVVVLDENNTVVHTEFIEDTAKEPDYDAALTALGLTATSD